MRACRCIVELYEVTNWENTDPAQWQLADDTWECDANRIYFYDRAEAPTQLIQKMIIRERHVEQGGHGWLW